MDIIKCRKCGRVIETKDCKYCKERKIQIEETFKDYLDGKKRD